MTDEEIRLVERELMMLGRHSAMGAFADSAAHCERLERSAYILMSRIEMTGPMSIGQLAEAFSLDVSTVNRQTAAMLRAGLVERILDPDGGVARKFRLTDYGLTRLHQHRSTMTAGLAVVLSGWTPEEVRCLTRALTHLNASIEHHQRAHPAKPT